MINPNRNRYRSPDRFFKSAFIITAFMVLCLSSGTAEALDILVGTEGSGTFSHFTGRNISRLVNKYTKDLNCKTLPGSDSVHNLTNLKSGSLDLVLVDSRMLSDAVNKRGYFKFLDIRYDNLRVLLPLYSIPISLVARKDADIKSLEGLKGKRFNAGLPLSPERLAVEMILTAKKWGRNDFSLFAELPASQAQDTMAFCHGNVQAMIHLGVHPDPAIEQLLKLCNAGLVGIKDKDTGQVAVENAAYIDIDINSDIYKSLASGYTTLGMQMLLVTTEELDADTVYQIMQALASGQKYLNGAHPALASLNVGKPAPIRLKLPLHPGAAKFFAAQ